jgi:hypothetical protein
MPRAENAKRRFCKGRRMKTRMKVRNLRWLT